MSLAAAPGLGKGRPLFLKASRDEALTQFNSEPVQGQLKRSFLKTPQPNITCFKNRMGLDPVHSEEPLQS